MQYFSVSGDKIAESYSKSPDLASWGAPVILKAEIPLKTQEGNLRRYLNKDHNFVDHIVLLSATNCFYTKLYLTVVHIAKTDIFSI